MSVAGEVPALSRFQIVRQGFISSLFNRTVLPPVWLLWQWLQSRYVYWLGIWDNIFCDWNWTLTLYWFLLQFVLLIAVAAPALAEATPIYLSPGLPSKGFYTLPESDAPAVIQRMRRSPLDPATALGLASVGVAAGGIAHSTRNVWNPFSTKFWEGRGKTECSSNPFSSAYCGRSNPAKCSRNPFSRRYCGNNN